MPRSISDLLESRKANIKKEIEANSPPINPGRLSIDELLNKRKEFIDKQEPEKTEAEKLKEKLETATKKEPEKEEETTLEATPQTPEYIKSLEEANSKLKELDEKHNPEKTTEKTEEQIQKEIEEKPLEDRGGELKKRLDEIKENAKVKAEEDKTVETTTEKNTNAEEETTTETAQETTTGATQAQKTEEEIQNSIIENFEATLTKKAQNLGGAYNNEYAVEKVNELLKSSTVPEQNRDLLLGVLFQANKSYSNDSEVENSFKSAIDKYPQMFSLNTANVTTTNTPLSIQEKDYSNLSMQERKEAFLNECETV